MIPLLLALSCFPVDGPKLLARHLADALSEFSQIAPDVDFGYAPAPGVVRVIRGDEIKSMAARHSIHVTPPPAGVCFEWAMTALDAVRVENAIRHSLPEGASVKVLEISRITVPPGEIEFPMDMLRTGYWRGFVRYGQGSKFDI